MEEVLREFASHIALATELVCVLCIAIGSIVALVRVAIALARGRGTDMKARHEIFIVYAGWIILALEFALAADIVRTAIAPTWDQIGQLAAIAAIRTGLNYFLNKDVDERQEAMAAEA
ncbi:MAG: DUF1622 domain-containing protein [Caulobacter sp.]|nr:DUF1622 domain-containing protein [Caulobacter sp.]